MAKRVRLKQVALAMPIGVPHLERVIRGVLDYASQHGQWRLTTSPESPVLSLPELQGWPGDGIIAQVNTPADAELVSRLGVHVVNVSGALEHGVAPRVTVDDRAIGRMAAEHLLDCGFRRFAYYGVSELHYAKLREQGFRETVEQVGGTCDVCVTPPTLGQHRAWTQADESLQTWLKSFALPIGLFACSDYRARLILQACREIGLTVPDDVAVLGVDNNQIACEFCDPPLSSVSRSSERVGWEAAALLDQLMAGRPAPERDILIPPDSVVRRRSTDVYAIDDPEVAAAVRYMHEHLSEAISIEDLTRRQGVSRRSLENAFQRELGRAPHVYLTFLRIRRARQLLVESPKTTIREIARLCGFSDAKRFRTAFLRFAGVFPSDYRRIHGDRSGSH